MRDMLKTGMQWLADKQRVHMASAVYYRRASSSVRIPATRGRSEFDVPDGQGATMRIESADFLIHVSDLKLDGILIEPTRGDQIIEGTPEDGFLYEVMPGGDGVPTWRYSDDYHVRFRIHTKFVGKLSA